MDKAILLMDQTLESSGSKDSYIVKTPGEEYCGFMRQVPWLIFLKDLHLGVDLQKRFEAEVIPGSSKEKNKTFVGESKT